MAVAAGAAIVGAGLGIYSAVRAHNKETEARNQLDAERRLPMARYGITPAQSRYGQFALNDINNPQGFSGADTQQFNDNLAKVSYSAYNNGINAGGGSLSKAILANNLGYQTDAINKFAVANEGIRRSNRNSGYSRYGNFANTEQSVANQNTGFDQNYQVQLEKALGESIRQQSDVQSQTYNNFSNDLMGAGASYLAGSGRYGKPTYSSRYDNPFISQDSTYYPNQPRQINIGRTDDMPILPPPTLGQSANFGRTSRNRYSIY